FLYESPITWYASKKKWDLSPGFDGPGYPGFTRPIVDTCLYCHAGQFTNVDGAVNRLAFTEKAISCESCHGPGSLHRDLHEAKKSSPGQEDLTIVNPAKLPRNLQEDICAHCHYTGATTIVLRGRAMTDFRPGAPLSDYRIHYRVEGAGDQMTVVGHVEQL